MDAAQRKEYQILLRGVPRFKDDGQTVWPEWRLAFETWMLYSGMSDFPVPGGNEQVKKMAAVSAFEGKATRALSTYGPGICQCGHDWGVFGPVSRLVPASC